MRKFTVRTISLLICICFFPTGSFAQGTIVPVGSVSGTWALEGSPFLIQGDIEIPNDSTLTVEPGVKIEFQDHFELNVQGVLLAVGTKIDTIVFTIKDTTGFNDPDTNLGGWGGITFRNTSEQNDSSKIIYCKLEFGKSTKPDWPHNSGGAILNENYNKILISNTSFTHNMADWGGAIGIVNSDLHLTYCTFSDNHSVSLGGSIAADFSSVYFTNCDFLQNHSDLQSGGIHSWNSELYVSKCNFIENSAVVNYGGIGSDSSNVYIDNSTFNSNSSIWGGAISVNFGMLNMKNCTLNNNYADHGGSISSRWNNNILSNLSFSENEASYGGAMSITNCNLDIDSSSFFHNQADEGGAIEYIADTSNLNETYQFHLTNNSFVKNSATNFIGGIRIDQNDSKNSLVNILIDKCLFKNNSADHVTALRILGNIDNFTVSNSIFQGNKSTRWAASSTFSDSCSGKVFNCLYINNQASLNGEVSGPAGAGIAFEAMVDFTNCTFANNSAGYGAGIALINGGKASITNSIFWGNYPDQIGFSSFNSSSISLLDLNYCDVQDGVDSVKIDTAAVMNWGMGNINIDPLFVDAQNNDFHIRDFSPCIGVGIDSIKIAGHLTYSPLTDIEGNTRPNPSGSMPDIGAYENPNGISVDISKEKNVIYKFALNQNYPNPFNPSTTITYQLPAIEKSEKVNVQLIVYDILGQEVTTIVKENQNPGNYEVKWNGSKHPSGIYFYRIKSGKFIETKKMILLR